MISLDCFACRSKITAPDNFAGRSGKCPKCGALILFSATTFQSPPSEPPTASAQPRGTKPKKKFLPKKEKSLLPVYLACGGVGLVVILALGSWMGISFYLENRRTREIQEKELAELERKRGREEKTSAFLTAQQQLDEANLKFKQAKQEKAQAAMDELDRQNRELKLKKEKAFEDAAKELKDRNEKLAKEAQEKEKAAEQEKRRELDRKKQLDMIEEDHKTILSYKKIHVKGRGTIRDMLWSPPLRAISVKGKDDDGGFVPKEGLLYRLQGVVGENRTPLSYYFFVVNRECVEWQPAKNNKGVTMCKIIGELEIP